MKAGNTEIAVFDASMMEADAGSGMENMGMEDLALPFLKVLSGNDPVLDDDTVDARKGDIYNTVTGVAYRGKDGVRVVPCSYQRRFIQWAPRGSGSGAPMAIYDPGMYGQKRSVLPRTIKTTLSEAREITLKRRINTSCFSLTRMGQPRPRLSQ